MSPVHSSDHSVAMRQAHVKQVSPVPSSDTHQAAPLTSVQKLLLSAGFFVCFVLCALHVPPTTTWISSAQTPQASSPHKKFLEGNFEMTAQAVVARRMEAQGVEVDADQAATHNLPSKATIASAVAGAAPLAGQDLGTESNQAQFLMKSTFGPTRRSMQELKILGYEAWVKKQMSLPATSHRSHFRMFANPKSNEIKQDGYLHRGVCDSGSRWDNRAFDVTDVGKMVKRLNGSLYIEDVWRTATDTAGNKSQCTDTHNVAHWLQWGSTCKQMARMSNCQSTEWRVTRQCRQTCFDLGLRYPGDDCSESWEDFTKHWVEGWYICSVQVGVGGLVSLSQDKRCGPRSRRWLINPSILSSASQTIPSVEGSFLQASGGWSVMSAEAATRCDPNIVTHLLRSGNSIYRFDPRMKLSENTIEKPDTSENAPCVERTFVNEHTCRVNAPGSECLLSCGSPGETGNDASAGHQFPIFTEFSVHSVDHHYDRQRHVRHLRPKQSVWGQHAMFAEDQLRQRVAWALSQVLVVGEEFMGTELYTNYYDIFVRSAFGNYKDILREVTFSPLMAHWLTYHWSRSFDASKSFPDENYAREILQLFTIGVWKLNPDGSRLQVDGADVPTYNNQHIMDFARVFTGFSEQERRANLEYQHFHRGNKIDPMRIRETWHDVYPKSNLEGGFLGDYYPLCADLPPQAFLQRGARYEFEGYSYSEEVLEVAPESPLFRALCDSKEGGECAFRAVLTLEESLACSGEAECRARAPAMLKVGNGFYRYAAPPCVHLFFFNGQVAATEPFWRTSNHICTDPSTVAAPSCCSGCSDVSPAYFGRWDLTCQNAETKWKTRHGVRKIYSYCNKSTSWRAYRYCEHTCSKLNLGYDGSDCSAGAYRENRTCKTASDLLSFAETTSYCKSLGMQVCKEETAQKCTGTSTYIWTPQTCSMKLHVFADGSVAGHAVNKEASKFKVDWTNGFPESGEYDADVLVKVAFDEVPNSTVELLETAKIGAFAPVGNCTHNCAGEIMVYAPNGVIDADTVFGADGRFFKNVLVEVRIGEHTFRNPPVFFRPGKGFERSGKKVRAAVSAEVDSLLEHLVHHPNTPVFIGKKLIQRMVTSNPSPAYLNDVGEAFRTGAYNGTIYSGRWGCLAATVAAILLHPEAAKASPTNGMLREPMIKMLHFLRAMEYSDSTGDQFSFAGNIQESIGQFPYQSPTVFNFYDATYKPMDLGKRSSRHEPEPEAEPEPEPEPEPEHHSELLHLSAPEFQIFTPPWAIEFLNGMVGLIEGGTGFGLSGQFTFAPEASSNVVPELGLLLTGGRLTASGVAVVQGAYDKAGGDSKQKLRSAQQAILLTPEYHNLGAPMVNSTEARSPQSESRHDGDSSYKAVVFLMLAGGADTYNAVVPVDCELAQEYAKRRGSASLDPRTVHKIETQGQQCEKYGLHPSFSFLADLYDKGQMAVMSNIGGLVEPTNRSMLDQTQRCNAQYSHSDAQMGAKTLQCQTPDALSIGVGGRIADALSQQGLEVASFSVAGMSKWSQGEDTGVDIVDRYKGYARFREHGRWQNEIANLTSQSFGNIYFEEYAKEFQNAINVSETLGEVFDNSELQTPFPRHKSSLSDQLRQVARLISTRSQRKVNRDFFFVSDRGWDMHKNLKTGLADKFKEVDDALKFFVTELKAQGTFDSTLLFSMSEFGRTLDYNGQGTDHGWGGNHFVLGGSVKGGRMLNKFLETYAEGSEYDAGRGRVIPQYPWESMLAPIAEWTGIERPGDVFENLQNFDGAHINSLSDLFEQ